MYTYSITSPAGERLFSMDVQRLTRAIRIAMDLRRDGETIQIRDTDTKAAVITVDDAGVHNLDYAVPGEQREKEAGRNV